MKAKISGMAHHMLGALCVSTTLILVLFAAHPASAQWSAGNAQAAWSGYQNAYLYPEPDGYSRVFVTQQGGKTMEDFWRQAEEIEVAEDAYNENPTTANKNMVQSLCDGFVNYMTWNGVKVGDNWSSDLYNDDLMWATIAFARAYLITGTGRWLTDAENNFATVWNRGLASNGGLYWYAGGCTGHPATGCQNTLQGSVPNWTFVWAGNILYSITGNSTYKTEKDSVYTWAKANLYDSTTGEIMNSPGVHTCQCTYNYGVAMIAGTYQGSNVMVPKIADYVFNNLTNYDGTYSGYNIMPDYGQCTGDCLNNGNNDGFNGILMRGVGFANAKGYLPSADLAAAQANIDAAWSHRNGIALSWNDWDLGTPGDTGNYSWDDSPTLAGMLDLPPTA